MVTGVATYFAEQSPLLGAAAEIPPEARPQPATLMAPTAVCVCAVTTVIKPKPKTLAAMTAKARVRVSKRACVGLCIDDVVCMRLSM